ncbi:MAG TPA: helix-turn-helix domain-containing protein [Chloroflexia bacterium]|jgi:uncharacterized protein (DUF3820 family)
MRKGVTIDDAARKLRLSTKTVRRYVEIGKLSGEKIDGRWIINLPEDVEEYVDQEGFSVSSLQAQLEAMRTERDWLRGLVDELTAVNRGLALALQEVGAKSSANVSRRRLQVVPSNDGTAKGESSSNSVPHPDLYGAHKSEMREESDVRDRQNQTVTDARGAKSKAGRSGSEPETRAAG